MQLLAGKLEHALIGLDGHHDRGLRGQKRGQGACSRADLQHHVVGVEIGRIGQYAKQVQIDEEILPDPVRGLMPASAKRRIRNDKVCLVVESSGMGGKMIRG